MTPVIIKGANANPGAPENWDSKDGTCGSLPIRYNGRSCVSAWKPTLEELAILVNGGYVELTVIGWQVPVALSTIDETGVE